MRMRRSGREKGELEYSQMWTYPSGLSRNMAGSGKGPSASRTFLGLLMKRPHLQGRQEADLSVAVQKAMGSIACW